MVADLRKKQENQWFSENRIDKSEFTEMLICVACSNVLPRCIVKTPKTKEEQTMLNENIKNSRKRKGISQEELAIKLNVVRQTISKWENGLSVPDSEMLIALAEELDTSVSLLLGETANETVSDDIKTVSEKLEVINLQFSKQKRKRVRAIRWFLIALCVGIITVFAVLAIFQSAYLSWDYSDPELAVVGTILHGFEFFFVRFAPIAFLASLIGIVLTYRKR